MKTQQDTRGLEPETGVVDVQDPAFKRDSCIFQAGQGAPVHLKRDTSAHRLHHHFYEDLLS